MALLVAVLLVIDYYYNEKYGVSYTNFKTWHAPAIKYNLFS